MNEVNVCGIANPPKKMSQTEQELEKARSAKNMLFDTIAILSERLKPALRQQNPCTVGECEKCESFLKGWIKN